MLHGVYTGEGYPLPKLSTSWWRKELIQDSFWWPDSSKPTSRHDRRQRSHLPGGIDTWNCRRVAVVSRYWVHPLVGWQVWFHLIAQSVRQGTVSPTSYTSCSIGAIWARQGSAHHLQIVQHVTTIFSGTVSVPAPCQYAHKLAFMTGTAIKTNAHEKLFSPTSSFCKRFSSLFICDLRSVEGS